nr:MAG TPA: TRANSCRIPTION FACTOR GATA-1 FINGER, TRANSCRIPTION REGULATION [Caudoviricetes sp.]
MRKLDDTNRTRKKNVRHSWVKAGPGIQRCAICGITKQSEWRDGMSEAYCCILEYCLLLMMIQ